MTQILFCGFPKCLFSNLEGILNIWLSSSQEELFYFMNPTVEIIPTVDGSEIRRFHQFMQVRYPSIHRVDDTSKRWLVMGFLNHQQYVTPTWHILDLDDRLIPEQPL